MSELSNKSTTNKSWVQTGLSEWLKVLSIPQVISDPLWGISYRTKKHCSPTLGRVCSLPVSTFFIWLRTQTICAANKLALKSATLHNAYTSRSEKGCYYVWSRGRVVAHTHLWFDFVCERLGESWKPVDPRNHGELFLQHAVSMAFVEFHRF